MWRRAINGANCAVANNEGANITLWFVDILLHIVSVVGVVAHDFTMLNDGFGTFTVIHFGEKATPRTSHGFENGGIANRFNRFYCAFFREGNTRVWLGDTCYSEC